MTGGAYRWAMFAGILVSIAFWSRVSRRDQRLVWIYIGALIGAFAGAKVCYLLAEGWLDTGRPDFWIRLATGKTIVGGLLGGYIGVELTKSVVKYRQPTGDWFALIAPAGILLGRVGCLLHGCCLGAVCERSWFTVRDSSGIDRWPAVPVEMAFNLAAILAFVFLRKRRFLTGQHFHLYMMGYGLFRFGHEFLRADRSIAGRFTGYHFFALLLFIAGLIGFCKRRNKYRAAAAASC